MNPEMMIELCCAIGRLSDERDMLRRRVDGLVEQVDDDEQARRGLAAASTELAELRAKLALQTQIATGVATQRDEQTARLAEAQAEIARLWAERDKAKASKSELAVGDLARMLFDTYDQTCLWGELSDESRGIWRDVARTAIRRLCGRDDSRLTPAATQTGEVGT